MELLERKIVVVFKRNPERDAKEGDITYSGYDLFWEDGTTVGVNMTRFCSYGVAALMGTNVADKQKVEITIVPVNEGDPKTWEEGMRVRRLFIDRTGQTGRFYFRNGTPTELVFDIAQDDARAIEWIGLTNLEDGQRQWLDLKARCKDD